MAHTRKTARNMNWCKIDAVKFWTENKYRFTPKYIPALRMGWNDAIRSKGFSDIYDRAGNTFQIQYEHGRALASHYMTNKDNPRYLWVNGAKVPDFIFEAYSLVDDKKVLPPDIDPTDRVIALPNPEDVVEVF